MIKKIILLSAISSLSLFANTNVPSEGSNLNITIYNSDLAFINDKRSVDVQKGFQKLVYEGIPNNVITESVIPSFSKINTNLFSQNYVYNLISLDSMLNNSIDQEVEYYNNHYMKEENPVLYKGKLLSISPTMVQNNNTNKIETLNSQNQVIFNDIPKNMITKPSLVWNMQTEKEGNLDIDLKYLTRGISWNSDYVLNLNDKSLDLNGWITIKNNSGVGYDNATITCLAGEVNRNHNLRRDTMMKNMGMEDAVFSGAPEVKQEAFSDYHIYKIPFKEDIKNKENKQIAFINKSNIIYKQYGMAFNNYFENYGEQKLSFTNTIEFKNSDKNNLGIPLPTGNIRMYKKDSKGKVHFIGEDRIGNIPKEEDIKLNIGEMFDVVGDKKIVKYKADRYIREVKTKYSVRNRGEDSVIVKINENIPTYGREIFVESSCNDICSIEKKNAFVREFTIKLKPEQEYEFTSEFEVNFH